MLGQNGCMTDLEVVEKGDQHILWANGLCDVPKGVDRGTPDGLLVCLLGWRVSAAGLRQISARSACS